ncbi:MAG: biopolymer transporter ExbD [Pseudomonadota bacterium]|jgi:biopolymer transport protein ExbD|nr:biopolymer transporter ExbD [Burkholderiaceae bacterium]MDQ3446380.1 biopolymer transporter ExbD [Pseudomonadota bacterium]
MRFRRALDEEPELNLIPLIDVLLVVLIFLAVSTTYSRFAELQITLPSADAAQPTLQPNEINVAVTADGRYAIERQLLASNDVRAFADALRAANKGPESRNLETTLLIINADAQAPHQAVIGVMEAARLAGIVRISFATQRTTGGK